MKISFSGALESGATLGLLLVLASILVYAPTFTGGFILDDRPLIENNTHIREVHSIWSYLCQEDGITDRENFSNYHTGYYRPLINLSYFLDFKVWGMNGYGFRITNLILHIAVVLLIFKILEHVIRDRFAAFCAALIFAVHPVHTESVSWVTSRNNIMVTLFSLLTFIFYEKSRSSERLALFIASLLFFAMAILSKEFALLALPIFVMYKAASGSRNGNLSRELLSYVPFVLIVAVYLVMRQMVTGAWISPTEAEGLLKRLYFAPCIAAADLRLLVFPFGLHSFIVGYPQDYLNARAMAGFLFLFLTLLILWKSRKDRLFCFSVLSFLLALIPVLHVVPTSSVTLISARWLYFPSVFLCIILARGIRRVIDRRRAYLFALGIPVILYLGSYTYALNRYLWHDEHTFFKREVVHFDNYYYAGGFAESLYERGHIAAAEKYFCLAVRFRPKAENYISYAALLTDTGRPDESIEYLERAQGMTMTRHQQAAWHNNMGMALSRLGNLREALVCFKKAVLYGPDEPSFQANLGALLGYAGEYAKSRSVLEKGLVRAPGSIVLRKNLALTLIRMKEFGEALSVLEGIDPEEWERNGIPDLWNETQRKIATGKTGGPET